ncbi:hypothetical protein GCM10009860_07360 [Microbacterium mitrae]|uniref:DUF2304 domain-containing protein n=1 Tax=Microbacterium mitrae TaxID=664640 RepID=A0A5C8HS48_9MICO|nr:DUF2304 domain-containing protein [Microbacterium mitrae]TXK06102.1 DUF2304 domain-containing protein [Microbacterium mitrae]
MIPAGIVLAVAMLGVVIWMLLTRKLREKYAFFWILIGTAMLVLACIPQALYAVTEWVGVELPVNLLFSIAIMLLMAVTLHLSWEQSQAEDEIRRAAEDIAILRADVERLQNQIHTNDAGHGAPSNEPNDV